VLLFFSHYLRTIQIRSGKVDRRAEHNAIERARRESLNVKFQQLAHALPNLQDDRRPSKSRIVEKALEWVRQTFHREQQYRQEIQQLRLENERLRAQLSNQTHMKGSFSGIDRHSVVASSSQHDTQIMPYSNWSSLSESYLFDPNGRPADDCTVEPQDDDDNSSNEGDYDYDRKLSFYGPLCPCHTF
jgi:thioesterase domain-containing protein